ncbi:MAG: hypothetical protein V1813_00230 [Candidatus Aenigmatarchaeota archaeon]
MAKDIMDTVNARMKDGWIRAWVAIEVLAVTEEAAEGSLKKHVAEMEKEQDSIIYKKDFKKSEKAENPFRKGSPAFSKVVEIELIARRFEDLVYLILNYAPSSVEILEPATIKVEMGEAQGILNSLAELVHNFVSATKGAVTLRT